MKWSFELNKLVTRQQRTGVFFCTFSAVIVIHVHVPLDDCAVFIKIWYNHLQIPAPKAITYHEHLDSSVKKNPQTSQIHLQCVLIKTQENKRNNNLFIEITKRGYAAFLTAAKTEVLCKSDISSCVSAICQGNVRAAVTASAAQRCFFHFWRRCEQEKWLEKQVSLPDYWGNNQQQRW